MINYFNYEKDMVWYGNILFDIVHNIIGNILTRTPMKFYLDIPKERVGKFIT